MNFASLLACLLLFGASPARPIFVAPTGNDSAAGSSAAPFATLDHARDAVRAMKKDAKLPRDGALVVLRAGTYELSQPFALSADDSGTPDSPVTYAAFPGEEVILSGGRAVVGFQPVTDPAVLARLDESARGTVLQADLGPLGIKDYGSPEGGGVEIFYRGEPMTLARWPNEGFTKIADLAVKDGHKIHGIEGSTVGKFTYDGERPARWVAEPDVWLHGYWFWDWSDQRQQIATIEPAQHLLAVKPPYHNYGYRKGQWFYAYNLISELDRPGEWYLDRAKGVLYFWPPEPLKAGEVVVSTLNTLVTAKDASNIAFAGITFTYTRGTAITVAGGENVRIAECTVHNAGGDGIGMSGLKHSVTACRIERIGSTGISLSGGDRATLAPSGLLAEDNEISRYGRVKPMYSPGISVNGVAVRAAHNHIHDAPHMAIQFSGNDHVLEFNHIHHVCLESNDAGAIYCGRNWTMRGNVIRHNYLHEIDGFEHKGCVGVYLDDMFASADIIGNVFWKVTNAAFIGGGRDNHVENNIFVDCKPALHIDARALNWAAYHADDWIKEAAEKGTISGIAFDKPPYSDRYQKLPGIIKDEPKAPKGNVISRNILSGGIWADIEPIAKPYQEIRDNLLDQDPHFVDPAKQDFRLKPGSPAFKFGFKPIPTDAIGPRPANVGAVEQTVIRHLLKTGDLDRTERRALKRRY